MISVVVPALNEERGIVPLYERIAAASAAWSDTFELIIVDDGSTDRTLAMCEQVAARDPRVKVVSFTRNFGHQPAVTAGLQHARGDVVAVMDADLQDPPEVLREFIEKVREGYDVVFAIRTKRKESLLKRACYRLYYRILRSLANIEIPLDAGDFCVMSRRVVDTLNTLPERNRFVRGLRTWIGFRQTGVAYERSGRFTGAPKYTLSKLIKLAIDGVINFSYRPLQFILLVGMSMGVLCLGLGFFILVQYVGDWTVMGFNPREARGWTSLILMLLLCSAVQLFCLGILGEYIGRLFEEAKQRPIYLVRKRVNLAAPEELQR